MKTVENLNSAVKITVGKMKEILKNKGFVRVAIDGNCAAGKTTFAAALSKEFNCNLFHMDDFYLTPEMRTTERLNEPGGNVDRERFLKEVLEPLKKGEEIIYKPYDCLVKDFKEPKKITPERVAITEGSYSCHPELFGFYDLHIFLSIPPEKQMERIIKRNGEKDAENFKNKWIPLEEKYFKEFKIKNKCDLAFEM